MTARRLWIAAAGVIAVAVLALKATFPAQAHPMQCTPIDAELQAAKERYGEVPAHIAVTGSGKLFVLIINPETGGWTAYLSPDNKHLCGLAGGDGFQPAPDSLKALAKPAKGA